jgi:hypothetical protein
MPVSGEYRWGCDNHTTEAIFYLSSQITYPPLRYKTTYPSRQFSRRSDLELIYKVNLKPSVFFAYQGFQAPEAVLSGFPESLALREFQRLNKSALSHSNKNIISTDISPHK